MKVLHVNTSDNAGGAAIAALRIIHALRAEGVDASLLCRDRSSSARREEVLSLPPSPLLQAKFVLERLEIFVRNGFSREGLFAVDAARLGTDITRLKCYQEADVIHLHWTNQALLSLGGLRRILQSGKRVVWTMHDMWPFTGVCHHSAECQRWQSGCGNCPRLRYPGKGDLSASTYRRKQQTYACGEMTFVGCSRWIASLAEQSPLLRGHRVLSIPNPVDTTFYCPAGTDNAPTRSELRQRLGLPQDKRLIFFTAFKVTDPGKGIDYLTEAYSLLAQEFPKECRHTALVLAGKESDRLRDSFPVPVYSMGYVSSEERMRDLYQACDLLVMPTLMDNLPNTIVEAMACGLPCVAFGVGGVPQMIDSRVNGYLASPCNSLDLAHGMALTLSAQDYEALSRNARAKAVNNYSEKIIARKYIEIYQ